MRRPTRISPLLLLTLALAPAVAFGGEPGEPIPYDAFQPDADCAECHAQIARQHEQAMMSRSYTHHWDEIEYFELALPHSRQEPKVAEIEAGCNGCHAPLAFLAGDIPPPPPAENSRANEGVSCDLCHTITGFKGEEPFNFNYTVSPGETKYGAREGIESPGHGAARLAFYRTTEFCGTCHNEKDPYGQWVKATQREWAAGPYARSGVLCQDCHMPDHAGLASEIGEPRADVRSHLFHGAHDENKLIGSVEVRIQPDLTTVKPGGQVRLSAFVVNAKAGHMIPTGSAEERLLWLHVEARDAAGKLYHLPVDRKGFAGEEYTVASSSALAYQTIGEIQRIEGFKGLPRDGVVPDGDRIFRLPYLDPKGRMTIAQWYTASFGPDYRLAPLRAVEENFTWTLPDTLPAGEVEVTATLHYSRLVSSVAEHLGVPKEEWEPVRIGIHRIRFEVLPGT